MYFMELTSDLWSESSRYYSDHPSCIRTITGLWFIPDGSDASNNLLAAIEANSVQELVRIYYIQA